MADPKQRLTYDEVLAAGLDDWRQIDGTLHTCFRTGGFAAGLALVDRVGAAAEEADHHPDVTLTWPSVEIALCSHDVGGLTSRDVDLARTISGYAAEAGFAADVAGLTVVEHGLDSHDPAEVLPFWAAMLGQEPDLAGEQVRGSTHAPAIWFQDAEELPEPPPQRWHPDVWVPADQAEARVQAALAAGGRLVSDAEAPSFWVLADPQGNRGCICTSQDR
jgi:4a-hydroxytetrahydrobiopterin dehydratase